MFVVEGLLVGVSIVSLTFRKPGGSQIREETSSPRTAYNPADVPFGGRIERHETN